MKKYIQKNIVSSLTILVIVLIIMLGMSLSIIKMNGYFIANVLEDNRQKDELVQKLTEENDRIKSIHKITQEILNTCDTDTQRKFLEKSLPHAIRLQVYNDIPVSGLIAMAIYESGYGTSQLSKKYNNYFGMKALDIPNRKNVVRMPTVDSGIRRIQPFRTFKDPYTGFLGFYEFLSRNNSDRYKKAFVAKNGADFIKEVLKAGYCPDKNYLRNTKIIIKRHHLDKLENILEKTPSEYIIACNDLVTKPTIR